MILILCLEETGGMMFNHRRQSRDKAILQRLEQIFEGKKLWMNSYSYKLYGELENIEIMVAEDFLEKASSGEVCFVETEKLYPFQEKIETIVVFWWNRKYPTDFRFDLELSRWKKIEVQEFVGTSHEKIIQELYQREEEKS